MERIKKILSQRVEWVLVVTFFVIMALATVGFYFWDCGKYLGMFLVTLPGVTVSFGVFVYIAGTYIRDNRTRTAQLYYKTIDQINKVEETSQKVSDWERKFYDIYKNRVAFNNEIERIVTDYDLDAMTEIWKASHPVIRELENLEIQLRANILDKALVRQRIGAMLSDLFEILDPAYKVREAQSSTQDEQDGVAENSRRHILNVRDSLKELLR